MMPFILVWFLCIASPFFVHLFVRLSVSRALLWHWSFFLFAFFVFFYFLDSDNRFTSHLNQFRRILRRSSPLFFYHLKWVKCHENISVSEDSISVSYSLDRTFLFHLSVHRFLLTHKQYRECDIQLNKRRKNINFWMLNQFFSNLRSKFCIFARFFFQ